MVAKKYKYIHWIILSRLSVNYRVPFNILKFKDREELLRYSISKTKANGLFLEFGVSAGRTVNYIASLVPDKTIYGFDSFEGLPEDWNIFYPKGSFKLEKLPEVRNNVKLIVGLFQESLELFLERQSDKVAFLHLDADLYSSTKYVLFTLAKNDRLQNGTVIQFDELCGYPKWFMKGEYKAFLEFIKEFNVRFSGLGQSMNKQCSIRIEEIKIVDGSLGYDVKTELNSDYVEIAKKRLNMIPERLDKFMEASNAP